jgi:hypothetical protein
MLKQEKITTCVVHISEGTQRNALRYLEKVGVTSHYLGRGEEYILHFPDGTLEEWRANRISNLEKTVLIIPQYGGGKPKEIEKYTSVSLKDSKVKTRLLLPLECFTPEYYL